MLHWCDLKIGRMFDDMTRVYAYGHDFGNTEVGGVLFKGGEQIKARVPTAFCRVDPSLMKNLGGVDLSAQNHREFPASLKTLGVQLEKKDPTAYAFGELALAQNITVWSGRRDEGRYSTPYSIRAI